MQFSTCDLIFFLVEKLDIWWGASGMLGKSLYLLYNMEPLHPAVHQLVFGVVSVPPFGQYVDI